MREAPFEPLLALRVLNEHGVRFILIGGFAATIRGSPVITGDLDLCYARDHRNLEALAEALQELQAKLRGATPDVPFQLDAQSIKNGDHFTFNTSAGLAVPRTSWLWSGSGRCVTSWSETKGRVSPLPVPSWPRR